MKFSILALLAVSTMALSAQALERKTEELNPFAADVEDVLTNFDAEYERETGMSAWLEDLTDLGLANCFRQTCPVWAFVDKSEQRLYLYMNGNPVHSWLVSTGMSGFDTPDFDRHPNGRIYDRYTSTKWPEGDYRGLGNMPYAVFITGGFALHGTPQGNWRRLGRRASHGCIRQHPDHALYFNRLVRSYGARNAWITVQ